MGEGTACPRDFTRCVTLFSACQRRQYVAADPPNEADACIMQRGCKLAPRVLHERCLRTNTPTAESLFPQLVQKHAILASFRFTSFFLPFLSYARFLFLLANCWTSVSLNLQFLFINFVLKLPFTSLFFPFSFLSYSRFLFSLAKILGY